MRELRLVDAGDPQVTFAALRTALSADGPAILARRSGARQAEVPSEVEKRVALVVETSGSTANPKRVAITADAALAAAAASESGLGGPGQWLLALPVEYIGGMGVLVRSIAAGTTPVMMPMVAPAHFNAERFVAAAGELEHPVRLTSLVPAQLATLIAAEAAHAALQRFDGILLGGQAAPSALLERAGELGLRLTRTYGATETCGGCVYDGSPIGSAEMRIVDGQVELAGPMLAEGYLGDPARTDAAFHAENGTRWYRTGDAGEIVDGLLTVIGRRDDLFISGGIKVSAGELERFIGSETALDDAIVVIMPSEKWGSVPVVVSTRSMALDELRAVVSARLGAAASPDRMVTVDQIPLLQSGKPDRRSLRAMLAR
jgi:o-succinylbenzoate---CoA ligase